MLSSASKYAINAVLYLALNTSEENKMGVAEIAEAIAIPKHFLAKVLQDLSRKGVVSSSKGPGGGFYLTTSNKKQKLLTVIEHIDGLSKFDECILGLKECKDTKPCPVHTIAKPYKDKIFSLFKINTIAHIADKIGKGEAFLIN